MSSSAKQKRLDKVWLRLTPKEWAIWLADQIHKYPSLDEFMRAAREVPLRDSPPFIAFLALSRQAQERHPGSKPEAIEAQRKLETTLRTDFLMLKTLLIEVNRTIRASVELNRLGAALSTLVTMLQQGSFARTAAKCAHWIVRRGDLAGEEEQQMLRELGVYMDVRLVMPVRLVIPLTSHPSPDVASLFASLIEGWVNGVSALILDWFAQRAAVQVIQTKYFDNHSILFRDIEAAMDKRTKLILATVATVNKFLNPRPDLLNPTFQDIAVEPASPGQPGGRVAIDIEAIQADVKTKHADALAVAWAEDAKFEAAFAIMDETGEGMKLYADVFKDAIGF